MHHCPGALLRPIQAAFVPSATSATFINLNQARNSTSARFTLALTIASTGQLASLATTASAIAETTVMGREVVVSRQARTICELSMAAAASIFDIAFRLGEPGPHPGGVSALIRSSWPRRARPSTSSPARTQTATVSSSSDLRLLPQVLIAAIRKPTNIVCTQFGNFNLQPTLGEKLIPRNYGQSPGYFVVNLTASKTWTFGTIHSGKSAAATPKAAPGATSGAAPATRTAGIPGLGPGGLGGGAAKEAKRYTMVFSISVQNLLNHNNPQPLEGNLSSPSFGESLGLNGFGGFGAPGSAGAGNRRIIGRLRFSF